MVFERCKEQSALQFANINCKKVLFFFAFLFFGRRRLKKRSEKTDCPAEKETPKKEKGGGKRPRRFAAPSAWPGNVFEFAFS